MTLDDPAGISRRQFLRACGALAVGAAVGPLLAACGADKVAARARPAGGRARRFIVVGGGIAGIAAARRIHDAGHTVIVLEARDRIGGRIHSMQLAGAPVELGANWVHGTDGNPLMPLLKRAGVKLRGEHEARPFVVDAAGTRISSTQLAAARADATARLRSAAARAEELDDDVSLARVLDVGPPPPSSAALVLRTELQNEYGADPRAMSAWWYGEGGTIDGEEPLVIGGYDRIVTRLARGLDVRKNVRVRRVEARPSGVRVHAANGARLDADAVVIAVPVAVLQAGAVHIDLDVSALASAALSRIGTGTLEKVLLRFAPGDWLPDSGSLATSDPRHVARGFAEFVAIEDHGGATTIVALAGGSAAAALARSGRGAMLGAALSGLRSIIGDDLPKPLAWAASSWTTDPLARGSYSFLRPGGAPQDRALLGEVLDGRLVLAGEALDEREPATVHGAYRSGRRAAERIVGAVVAAG